MLKAVKIAGLICCSFVLAVLGWLLAAFQTLDAGYMPAITLAAIVFVGAMTVYFGTVEGI